MRFDFAFDYATASSFVQMFLETNWQHLSAFISANEQNVHDFGQHLYGVFDKYCKKITKDVL